MSTSPYTGLPNYNSQIYIFDPSDFVLGSENGTSNIPIKELADNTTYLKKFKGVLLKGNGDPNISSPLSGVTLDDDNLNNTLYLDEDTGNFWKLTQIDPSIVWVNSYANANLTVKSLRLNEDGDVNDYVELSYDSSDNTLQITDTASQLADLKLNTLNTDSIKSNNGDITGVVDQEILLLFDITQESENADGYFSAKVMEDAPVTIIGLDQAQTGETVDTWTSSVSSGVLSDYLVFGNGADVYINIRNITEGVSDDLNGYYKVVSVDDGLSTFTTDTSFKSAIGVYNGSNGFVSVDNSAQIKYNFTDETWEFIKRDGTDLEISVSSIVINDKPTGFIADRLINNDSDFNDLFNGGVSVDDTIFLVDPSTSEPIKNEYIIVKPKFDVAESEAKYKYVLNNSVEILESNVRIECVGGAYIEYSVANISIQSRSDSLVSVQSKDLDNDLSIKQIDNYFDSNSITPNEELTYEDGTILVFDRDATTSEAISIASISSQEKNIDSSLEDSVSPVLADSTVIKSINFKIGSVTYLSTIFIDTSNNILVNIQSKQTDRTLVNVGTSSSLGTVADIDHIDGVFDESGQVIHVVCSNDTDCFYNFLSFPGSIGGVGSLQNFTNNSPTQTILKPSIDSVKEFIGIAGNNTFDNTIALFTKDGGDPISSPTFVGASDSTLITSGCLPDCAWLDIDQTGSPEELIVSYQDNFSGFGNKGKTIKYNFGTTTATGKDLTTLVNQNSLKTFIERSSDNSLYVATTEETVVSNNRKIHLIKYDDSSNTEYEIYDGSADLGLMLNLNGFFH